MKARLLFILFLYSACRFVQGQTMPWGPYSVFKLSEGIFHIEDANDLNPPGNHSNADSKFGNFNNCSDMYLILGSEKALLIDLSNAITWDTSAATSLRKIVYNHAGTKKLYITVTHNHGDHLGMLPAFRNDPKAEFWIPDAEFKSLELFPRERTVYFSTNSSIDLGGGMIVNSLELGGHTPHSTVYFVHGRNMVFTGDAIGSGNGVWLFNEACFPDYKKSINLLISYIEDPANEVNADNLIVYGGHYWQKGEMKELTARYIYDMRTLIDKIGAGTAETQAVNFNFPFLNTNFRYGTATITWNKEAAEKYRQSIKK